MPENFDTDAMARSYLTALLWSSSVSCDPENPDAPDDIAADTYDGPQDPSVEKDARDVCAAFITECRNAGIDPDRYDVAGMGHDFALTRNGHGTGFWDRADIYGEDKDKLTELSEWFGEADVYIGDDQSLYVEDWWIYKRDQEKQAVRP